MMLDFQCQACGEMEEMFFHPSESKTARPVCPECGQIMDRIHVGGPAVVWARPMSFYNDKNLPGAELDGHWVTRKNSSRRKDGRPEREFITNRRQQLDYCKAEGLQDPADAGKIEATRNGLRPGIPLD